MGPRIDREFSWKQALAVYLLLALVLPMLTLLFAARITASQLLHEFIGSLAYTVTIGTLASFVMARVGAAIRHRPPAVKWVAIGIALLSIAAVGCFVAGWILVAVGFYRADAFWTFYVFGFKVSAVITLVFGLSIAAYKMQKGRLEATTLQLRTQELERERALKLASEARLSSLESRIHPHFLFNTLNSISSLIQEDPQRAERLIERMSALLRFSLDSAQAGSVALHQEMKIVRDYLEIERARFGDRLRFEVDIPAEFEHLEVPPLSIQTLVENSVKYVVSQRREGGSIRVSAARTGSCVVIEVWDDGAGFGSEAILAGHGLDNLQARLLATFGADAALGLRRTDSGMSVTISLPQLAPQ